MASVRRLDPKDPKSPWVVEYTDAAGKRRRKTPKTGLKKDADALRQKIERDLGDDVHTPSRESIKIAALCEEYLSTVEDRVRNKQIGYCHYRKTESLFRTDILPAIGAVRLCDLQLSHLRTIVRGIMARGCKARYAKEKLQAFLLVEQYAIKRGYTKKQITPALLADMGNLPAIEVDRFERRQVSDLLREAHARNIGVKGMTDRGHLRMECYVNIAALCGLRFGEICGLTVDSIDFEASVIHVRHNMTRWGELKKPKTKAGKRDVPMAAPLAFLLRQWLEKYRRANDRDLLFWCLPPKAGDKVCGPRPAFRKVKDIDEGRHRKGAGQWQQANFHKGWLKLLQRAGIEKGLHFHALRHFFAANLLDAGVPVTEVAKLLGHSKPDVTLEIYAYAIREEHRHVEMLNLIAADLVPESLLMAPDATKTRHDAVSV